MNITDFYNNTFVDYASYSTLRMIGSAIDGQKNVHRKILYTILEKNIKNEIKVSQLNSKVAEFSEYLHGDMSGSISKMAQSFSGSNNVPLLKDEGSYGTRFKNEPSAPRYIYTYGTEDLFKMFNKKDSNILEKQVFEGHKIEPKFYLPSLPVILLNGSEGMGTGFAQKILPRSPSEIKKHLKDNLNGKNKKFNALPYFKGFNGTIEKGENDNQFIIKGKIERLSSTKVLITEIPVNVELKTYIKTLYKLQDSGSILSFKDLSNKTFKFEVIFLRSVLSKLTDEKLLEKLKLVKTVSENYTAIDENLRVRVFNNISEIFDYYIDVKMRYLQKRKDYLVEKLNEDINLDNSKYLFIKAIVDNKLKVQKRKKTQIEKDLESFEKIIKKDGTYDYLLNMSIYNLTIEKMDILKNSIIQKVQELREIKTNALENMWLKELEGV